MEQEEELGDFELLVEKLDRKDDEVRMYLITAIMTPRLQDIG